MDLDEQIALRMAQARIEDAVRAAEERRALRAAHAGSSVRGRLLAWLGHWMHD